MRKTSELRQASLAVLIGLACAVCPAGAEVNLEWRHLGEGSVYQAGEVVCIGLYAVSDGVPWSLAGVDAIVSWDPSVLQMMDVDNTDAPDWIVSRFQPADPYGLNEVIPPQDGDGFYEATSRWGDYPEATANGLLVTTFQFMALTRVCATELGFLASAGAPYTAYTRVYNGLPPPPIITGELIPTRLAVDCYDMNCDLAMDGRDVAAFVVALTDPEVYAASYGCVNVGLDDLEPFVAALLSAESPLPAG